MKSQPSLEGRLPRKIGPFRVISRLGAGGMGVVYLASHPQGFNVALKVIRPEFASDVLFRQRFRREVAAAKRVQGIFTARVVAAETELIPYLATEFIDGPTLDGYIEEHGPLGGEQLRAFAVALAEAIGAVHAAGIVHRDLKPSNILLSKDGPRVIDFGIAKAAEGTSMTQTGVSIGTPAWMAPEQARGSEVGPAADVFAWGSIVAYASSGRAPFGEGASDAVLYRIVHEQPDLEGVPDEVREVTRQSLAKDPNRRPTVVGLISALLDDAEITQPGHDTETRVQSFVRDTWNAASTNETHVHAIRTRGWRRPVFATTLGALLLATSFGVTTLIQADRSPQEDDRPLVNVEPSPSTTVEQADENLVDPRDVPISTLLRSGTVENEVLYADMDGADMDEIIISSNEVTEDPVPQHYLDIYSWRGKRWRRVFDATRFRGVGDQTPLIPFLQSADIGGEEVFHASVIDFFSDGTPELAFATQLIGAGIGPVKVSVISLHEAGPREEFSHSTTRGGIVRKVGRKLRVTSGTYDDDDPLCCPTGEIVEIIGADNGFVEIISSKETSLTVDLESESLGLEGLGPVRVGMTPDEVMAVLGEPIDFPGPECETVAAPDTDDIGFMFIDNRLARVNIWNGPVTTLSGMGIGSSEDEVKATYPGQIKVEPHPYEGGAGWHYLVFQPREASDQDRSLIFETDGSQVVSFRAGETQAVSYIEGCF
jgi:serine/threonine protein kinase